ncbi:DMT family transporter [Crenobacter cavernae]|uniref:DMT family transporter n=1 Tax=Crenobacter cavernae TaxID=2290923 RepID=A0A345Y5M6_9NEIS|nr:DMT family transporter [Crenobacter cavernae]AXK39228.1 DMT family transporter [Crenobacter cavernae]
MQAPRLSIDGLAAGLMALLCALWGLQQIVIKLAAQDIAPIMQIALRSGLAALLVGGLMRWRGHKRLKGTFKPGVAAGLLFGVEFVLIAVGLAYTSASHMVVFLYTAPIFTALGLAWRLPSERLSPRQWIGIALAFSGLAFAFLGDAGGNADTRLGDALAVLAGLAWGATTVVVRCSRLADAEPAETLLYQLVAGCVVALAYAAVSGEIGHVALSWITAGTLFFQGVLVACASYLAWFWMLRRYQASQLVVFSFLTPLYGVAFGVLLLAEPLDAHFLAGACLVLAGIFVVNGGVLFGRAKLALARR